MSLLASLAANWKLGLYALVAVGLAAGGFWVKSRLTRADEADRLESINTILQKQATWQRQKLERAEQTRIDLSAQLAAARANVRVKVETVIKRIPIHIKDNRACDIPVEVLRALNVARGHEP